MDENILYNAEEYAKETGRTVANVRYHCAQGNVEAYKLKAPGGHIWVIPGYAEIKANKRGRKTGWRKKK